MKRTLLPIIVPLAGGDHMLDFIFSPEYPDTAIALMATGPPKIYDLRAAGVGNAYIRATREGRQSEPVVLGKSHQLRTIGFRSPAVHAAYRPPSEAQPSEIAIVFGEGDTFVHRFDPRASGNCPEQLYFPNGCRLAYGQDDNILLAGSTDGLVTAFAVNGVQEDDEVRSEQFGGAIRTLCLQGSDIARVGTDRNYISQFSLSNLDSPPERSTFDSEVAGTVSNMKLNTMVWSPCYELLACAGIGNDVWLLNPATGKGAHCRLNGSSRIHSIQFIEDTAELMIFNDGGIDLVSFAIKDPDERTPYFEEKRPTRYFDRLPNTMMVGAHYYPDLLCIVHSVSEKLI